MKINELVKKFEKFFGVEVRCEDTKKYSLFYYGDQIKHANIEDVEILDWQMEGSSTFNIMSLTVIVSEEDFLMLTKEIKEREEQIRQMGVAIDELLDRQREIEQKLKDLKSRTGEIEDGL